MPCFNLIEQRNQRNALGAILEYWPAFLMFLMATCMASYFYSTGTSFFASAFLGATFSVFSVTFGVSFLYFCLRKIKKTRHCLKSTQPTDKA